MVPVLLTEFLLASRIIGIVAAELCGFFCFFCRLLFSLFYFLVLFSQILFLFVSLRFGLVKIRF